jgi:hypothetical protein
MCGCVLDSDSSGCVPGVGPYDDKLLISVKIVESFDYANDKSFCQWTLFYGNNHVTKDGDVTLK